MSSFPSSIDSFAGFTSTDTLAHDNHASQENQQEAAIVAIETKVGTGSSTPSNNTVLRGNGTGTTAYDQVHAATDISGVLLTSNGGTGLSSLGTGVSTFLGTPSSANLAAALTDETGTGAAVFANSPTLSMPNIVSSINDSNNNPIIKTSATATAVNQITIANSTAGNSPSISSTGNDTNIDLQLIPKGSGRVVNNGAGISAYVTVLTSETTASTSYVDLSTTTDFVTVIVGNSGMVLLSISAGLKNNSGTNVSVATYAATGANTIAASDTNIAALVVGTSEVMTGSIKILTGLTPGSTTFKLKYRVDGGTGTFERRQISAIPL